MERESGEVCLQYSGSSAGSPHAPETRTGEPAGGHWTAQRCCLIGAAGHPTYLAITCCHPRPLNNNLSSTELGLGTNPPGRLSDLLCLLNLFHTHAINILMCFPCM